MVANSLSSEILSPVPAPISQREVTPRTLWGLFQGFSAFFKNLDPNLGIGLQRISGIITRLIDRAGAAVDIYLGLR